MKQVVLVFSVLVAAQSAFASIKDFKNHIDMASNQKLNMNSRWTSLINSTKYATEEEVDEIKKFTTHKEWYLRNAALVALNKMDPAEAVEQARILVKDKALVVRSAAVQILAQDAAADTKKILKEELYKAYNFNKKSSLWIRKQIVHVIANRAAQDDREFFVKVLFDDDKKISELGAKTLARLTGQKLKAKNAVSAWRQYAKENNWY